MKRDKKISADISEYALNLLLDLIDKHERSKGWLLEKMIRKYCEDCGDTNKSTVPVVVEKKSKTKRFAPPTDLEVVAYFQEKNSTPQEAEKFWYFYDAKNWMVGKNKMKNWKSAASGWIKRNNESVVNFDDKGWADNLDLDGL